MINLRRNARLSFSLPPPPPWWLSQEGKEAMAQEEKRYESPFIMKHNQLKWPFNQQNHPTLKCISSGAINSPSCLSQNLKATKKAWLKSPETEESGAQTWQQLSLVRRQATSGRDPGGDLLISFLNFPTWTNNQPVLLLFIIIELYTHVKNRQLIATLTWI